MAKALSMEGTWDELSSHAAEFQGKRLRLTVVAEDAPAPRNLAEFLGDFVGCIDGSGANNSDDTGSKFAAYVAKKHEEQRL
jgi:hypothetical protein